jgi:probable rRNA maturation factor
LTGVLSPAEPTRSGPTVAISWRGTAELAADRRETQDADERWFELVQRIVEDQVHGDREVVLSVELVEPDQMAELNREHLGGDGPTDVLSFPIDGDPDAGADGPPPSLGSAGEPPWMLGDIVICPDVAARNAPDHAGTYDDEIALLLVHGLLHLLGMDHAADDERVAMQARERDLLERFHGPLARDPWSP